MAPTRRWSLNIHYHQLIFELAPPWGSTALDVGSGDGMLSFELAAARLRVTGIDPHKPGIERARSASGRTSIPEPDSNACVIWRSRGVLAIVGFARSETLGDLIRDLRGNIYKRLRWMTGRYWEHNAPIV
ncbi:MAG: SAM-dependent methyltransferase [Candidatus Poriferisodalaceae bacterium]|jgi:SAM-dependent methyltransferase